MSDFEQAVREMRHEIDKEAARLVRLGVPAWDAIIQARQHIERQRRGKATKPLPPAVAHG